MSPCPVFHVVFLIKEIHTNVGIYYEAVLESAMEHSKILHCILFCSISQSHFWGFSNQSGGHDFWFLCSVILEAYRM